MDTRMPTPEELMEKIDDLLVLSTKIFTEPRLTAEEHKKIYCSHYNVSLPAPYALYLDEVHAKLNLVMRRVILLAVTPPLSERQQPKELLEKLLGIWKRYNRFAEWMTHFWEILHRKYTSFRPASSIMDQAMNYFCDLVCDKLHHKFSWAAFKLAYADRRGIAINHDILSRYTFNFLMVIKNINPMYFKFYEEIILFYFGEVHFSSLGRKWLLQESFQCYLQKTERYIDHEEALHANYLPRSTLKKLREIGMRELLEKNAIALVNREDQQLNVAMN